MPQKKQNIKKTAKTIKEHIRCCFHLLYSLIPFSRLFQAKYQTRIWGCFKPPLWGGLEGCRGLGYLLIFSPLLVFPQENLIQQARQEYMESVNNTAIIYTGKAQVIYPAGMKHHPWYSSPEYRYGDLLYDNIMYDSIQMRLDVYRDELILLVPGNNYSVVLHPGTFSYARLPGYRILYSGSEAGLPFTGYYIELYRGKYSLYEKPSCTIDKSIVNSRVVYTFRQKSNYYILKEGIYHQVKNANSLNKVFPGQKKEIKQFSHSTGLTFKNDPRVFLTGYIKIMEE